MVFVANNMANWTLKEIHALMFGVMANDGKNWHNVRRLVNQITGTPHRTTDACRCKWKAMNPPISILQRDHDLFYMRLGNHQFIDRYGIVHTSMFKGPCKHSTRIAAAEALQKLLNRQTDYWFDQICPYCKVVGVFNCDCPD